MLFPMNGKEALNSWPRRLKFGWPRGKQLLRCLYATYLITNIVPPTLWFPTSKPGDSDLEADEHSMTCHLHTNTFALKKHLLDLLRFSMLVNFWSPSFRLWAWGWCVSWLSSFAWHLVSGGWDPEQLVSVPQSKFLHMVCLGGWQRIQNHRNVVEDLTMIRPLFAMKPTFGRRQFWLFALMIFRKCLWQKMLCSEQICTSMSKLKNGCLINRGVILVVWWDYACGPCVLAERLLVRGSLASNVRCCQKAHNKQHRYGDHRLLATCAVSLSTYSQIINRLMHFLPIMTQVRGRPMKIFPRKENDTHLFGWWRTWHDCVMRANATQNSKLRSEWTESIFRFCQHFSTAFVPLSAFPRTITFAEVWWLQQPQIE